MDRQKKLLLVGGAGLLLLILIIVIVGLAMRTPEPEPAPTPIITQTPTQSPKITPEPTPSATLTEPGQPVLPGETTVPTPVTPVETTPEPTPANTPEAGVPTLPGSSSNTTSKPVQTPKATQAVTPAFDFGMPSTAAAGVKLSVTVSATSIAAVEWRLVKKGGIEIEVNPSSSMDMEGSLTKDGGSVSFKNTGSYTLKATASATTGKVFTVERDIQITATTTTPGSTATPGTAPAVGSGFAFGLPRTAYTDTVITVSVLSGTEAVTWSVSKDGKDVSLTDAFTGKLSDGGGMIVFKREGKYTLTGATASGKNHSANVSIEKRP